MKAKIKGDVLWVYAKNDKELDALRFWCDTTNHVNDLNIGFDLKKPKKTEIKPPKVIEIKVIGIPSEIHILKGDLT